MWNPETNTYDVFQDGELVGSAEFDLSTAGPPPEYGYQNYDSHGNPTSIGNAKKLG